MTGTKPALRRPERKQDPREVARAATSLVASLERSLEALHDLRVPDFEILDHLVTTGKPQALSELSKQVWLSRSGTRLRVRLLAASGYVTIAEATSPRDGLVISVTQSGVDAHARALATVANVVDAVAAP